MDSGGASPRSRGRRRSVQTKERPNPSQASHVPLLWAPSFLLFRVRTHRKMSETANLSSRPCSAYSVLFEALGAVKALTDPLLCTKQIKSSEWLKPIWFNSSHVRTWFRRSLSLWIKKETRDSMDKGLDPNLVELKFSHSNRRVDYFYKVIHSILQHKTYNTAPIHNCVDIL